MVLKKHCCVLCAHGFGLHRRVHQLWLCHFPFHGYFTNSKMRAASLRNWILSYTRLLGSSSGIVCSCRTAQWCPGSGTWRWAELSLVPCIAVSTLLSSRRLDLHTKNMFLFESPFPQQLGVRVRQGWVKCLLPCLRKIVCIYQHLQDGWLME